MEAKIIRGFIAPPFLLKHQFTTDIAIWCIFATHTAEGADLTAVHTRRFGWPTTTLLLAPEEEYGALRAPMGMWAPMRLARAI